MSGSVVAAVGVYGGSFDPVHNAHLALAEQARRELGLDPLLLVPAANPPHKRGRTLAPAADRWEMLRRAVADRPGLQPSDMELRRPGASYTVDTLRDIQACYLGRRLVLLLGADSLAQLPTWRAPGEIVALADLAVAGRPGEALDAALAGFADAFPGAAPPHVLAMPLSAISSSDIRARAAAGATLAGLTPPAVAEYIAERGLYRRSD